VTTTSEGKILDIKNENHYVPCFDIKVKVMKQS